MPRHSNTGFLGRYLTVKIGKAKKVQRAKKRTAQKAKGSAGGGLMGALTVSAEVHVLRHNGRLLRESTFILSQFPPRVKTPRAFLANRQIKGGFRRPFRHFGADGHRAARTRIRWSVSFCLRSVAA